MIVCVLDDMQLEPGDRRARSQVAVELDPDNMLIAARERL